jgi:hypothetical protein
MSLMKLRSLVVVASTLLSAAAVRAQVGVYLNPVAIRASNSVRDSGTFAFLGQNSTSAMLYGLDFGGYYDFPTGQGTVKAGIDLRESILHGNNATLSSFLVGVRFSAKPFHSAVRPYIEPVVGVGSTRAPFTAIKVNKVQYGAFAGIDYPLQRHVDFRAVEIGYSSLTTASSSTVGGTAVINVPAASLLSISTGFVFHF